MLYSCAEIFQRTKKDVLSIIAAVLEINRQPEQEQAEQGKQVMLRGGIRVLRRKINWHIRKQQQIPNK